MSVRHEIPSSTQSPCSPRRLSLEEALGSARETRALVVGPGEIARVAEVFRAQFPGQRAVVVADAQTLALAGGAVQRALTTAGLVGQTPFVFSTDIYAEIRCVEQLEASLKQHDAIPVA